MIDTTELQTQIADLRSVHFKTGRFDIDLIDGILRENAALRANLEAAPHGMNCSCIYITIQKPHKQVGPCDCWKAAL